MVEARRRGPWERNQGSKTPLRVLIVEDSSDDALLVVRELVRGGYETYFERVDTPEAMREALDEGRWDVIISDHAMPRFSAPEALGILQEKALDLPFIIVSSEIGEDTAVAMMRAGAHDYVAKGNLTRLCPAVARELREAAERRERSRRKQPSSRTRNSTDRWSSNPPNASFWWTPDPSASSRRMARSGSCSATLRRSSGR